MMLLALLILLLALGVKCAAQVRDRMGVDAGLSAAAGLGGAMAMVGVLYPVLLFVAAPPRLIAAALLLAAIGSAWWAWPHLAGMRRLFRSRSRFDAWDALLAAGALLFTYRFIGFSYRWGGFDGWAQWSMHARFLTGEADWRALLATRFAHPDYPLMQPALIGAAWRAFGAVDALVPMLVSVAVALGLLIALHSAVRAVAPKSFAVAAVLLCCIDPGFARCAASQYADTLLAFWMLLAMAFLVRDQSKGPYQLVVAGFFAACAAWTKNEGIAFFAALSVVVASLLRFHIPRTFAFLGGALPVLLVLIGFKIGFAPPSDLAGPNGIAWSKLFDASRHGLVLRTGVMHLASQGGFFLPLLGAGLLLAWRGKGRLIMATVLLTAAAYYTIYLITPYEPVWHITHSVDRLAHQLVPLLLLALAASAGGRALLEWPTSSTERDPLIRMPHLRVRSR